MKAALAVGLWLAVGLGLALRGRTAPVDWPQVALMTLFWPLFLGAERPAVPPARGPVDRLVDALPDEARPEVDALRGALEALRLRAERLDAAAAELPADAPPAARALLLRARDRARAALAEAEGEIELAAARLLVLRAEGGAAGGAALLSGLLSRVRAMEEVEAVQGPPLSR